jgi:NAD(P)H-dependent FMN reductase
MLNSAIILASTRPGRNGEAVAQWVYGTAKQRTDARFELVDVKTFNLPLLDEPNPPATAAKIAEFDAFFFVTAECNHGIPGALKNGDRLPVLCSSVIGCTRPPQ